MTFGGFQPFCGTVSKHAPCFHKPLCFGGGGWGGAADLARKKKSRRLEIAASYTPTFSSNRLQQAKKQSSKLRSERGKAALGSNLQSSSCLFHPPSLSPPTPLLSLFCLPRLYQPSYCPLKCFYQQTSQAARSPVLSFSRAERTRPGPRPPPTCTVHGTGGRAGDTVRATVVPTTSQAFFFFSFSDVFGTERERKRAREKKKLHFQF